MPSSGHFAFDRRLLPYEFPWIALGQRRCQDVGIFTNWKVRQTLRRSTNFRSGAVRQKLADASTAEDVHQFVENALVKKSGRLDGSCTRPQSQRTWLATDFRLFVIDAVAEPANLSP